MSSPLEPLRPGDSVAAGHLRGLLHLARLVRRESALTDVLAAVARAVSDTLGFATVVVNLYEPETDNYEVMTVHGNARARSLLLGKVSTSDSWSPLLDPRFLRQGAFFIPAGAIDWDGQTTYIPELVPAEAIGDCAWQAADALFVTLDGSAGRHYGIISVDEPESGRRPDDQAIEVLSAVSAHAAVAIEGAYQFAELQAALTRNRAVIESSLDCVIAIDGRGRVLEFNPAAERTFGFAVEEVLGRELAELIIPPENRDQHHDGLQRGIAHNDWRLLGRRIETTALRANGSRLPVELTLTLVRGSKSEGPVVYAFVRDISERRRGEEQLTFLAYHDSLTGLPNRILIEQQLELAIARARRRDGAVVMMFVDLDDFKGVNDRFGHGAGDRLLTAVATRLHGVLRDSDLLARQGGDEFIVLLTDLSDDPGPVAESVAGKLLDALREPFVVAGVELRTGASIGISVYPDDAADTDALLRHADAAMYQAKAGGGGRIAFHHQPDPGPYRRSSLAAQLRRAMANSELELHYQPVWRLGPPRAIAGVEAMLCWQHPERGLLTSQSFISTAEQTAAGDDLSDWLLAEICGQARAWQDAGLLSRVSLDVSPHQLLAPGFAARLATQMAEHALAPGAFMIELTESAWTVDAADTLEVIADLRAAGAGLAIDGFGAGYSSLLRLRELDFDVIKIDHRLLAGVPADRTAVAVLRAIVDLARACDSAVVAQGVDTEEHVNFLSTNGIEHAQGSLLGQPQTAAQTGPLLARYRLGGRVAA